VPADAPGVRIGQVFKKMGFDGRRPARLVLGCGRADREPAFARGPRVHRIDARPRLGPIGISGHSAGDRAAAVDEACILIKERAKGTGRRFQHPRRQWPQARSARWCSAYNGPPWLCSAGRPFTRPASMAKLHSRTLMAGGPLTPSRLRGRKALSFSGSPSKRHGPRRQAAADLRGIQPRCSES